MPRRQHPEAKRTEAVRLATEDGLRPADIARRLNVNGATVRSWLHKARQDDPASTVAITQAQGRAIEAARMSWEQRRLALVNDLGEAAAEALATARSRAKARDRRDDMASVAIAIDKAELLSGRATSRSEVASVDAARESIKRVAGAARDELAERRQQQAA